uniref:Cadherin domain-containing protein n=1 Tax=Electrophorus electricus TaxID=8005 RepID=A0A4W4FVY0_ELEEL
FIVFVVHNCIFIESIASGQVVYSVSEESNPGTTVANLVKDLNLNVRDLEHREFQIVSGPNKRYFDVNVKTGILFLRERIDREVICGRSKPLDREKQPVIHLILSAIDGGKPLNLGRQR